MSNSTIGKYLISFGELQNSNLTLFFCIFVYFLNKRAVRNAVSHKNIEKLFSSLSVA